MSDDRLTAAAATLIFNDIAAERARQEAKFPDQHLPNGTGPDWPILGVPHNFWCGDAAETAKRLADTAAHHGTLTWHHVLNEEFREAAAEADPAKLRVELIQVAAVCVRWLEDLERAS